MAGRHRMRELLRLGNEVVASFMRSMGSDPRGLIRSATAVIFCYGSLASPILR